MHLVTKKVSFAQDQNSENRAAEHGNLDNTQKKSDHVIDASHFPNSGAIRTLDQLVHSLIFVSVTEAGLPIDLENFAPHGHERKDGGDAARSSKKCSRIKSEDLWFRNDVDIIRGAASHWGEGTLCDRASEATDTVLIVRKLARAGRDRFAKGIMRAINWLNTVKFDCQAQQSFKKRLYQQQSLLRTTEAATNQQELEQSIRR